MVKDHYSKNKKSSLTLLKHLILIIQNGLRGRPETICYLFVVGIRY